MANKFVLFLYLLIFSLLLFLFLSHSHSSPYINNDYPKYPCQQPHSHFPFCNASLPVPLRARSLISLLTLPEKILQLSNKASDVPRLGLPPYQWWAESLHGVSDRGPGVVFSDHDGSVPSATSFPNVILTAASFNRTLWRAVAGAIAVEARAMHNVGQAGLTYWAPNINVFRDPRWGRGQETPGEDPVVAVAYSVEYVKGFQRLEEESGKLMVSACCKHYTAYDLDKWGNFVRYTFNAKVSKQDMEDTFQPPFQSCIQDGKASCLMCSYNQIDGVPACARKDLLQKAREEWGLIRWKYATFPEDVVADVLKAGTDIDCGWFLQDHTATAVKSGKVKEEDIDRALFNLFSVLIRVGLFDGNPLLNQQYGSLGPGNVCTLEHRQLALEAARQGIVLLKNAKNFLPLNRKEVVSLAVIGPSANDTRILNGDYSGVPCEHNTLLRGLQSYVPETSFAAGCINTSCTSDERFHEAVRVARKVDHVVVVAGLNLTEETEELDRVTLLLPGKQMDLVNAIASVSKNPIVLVLMGGGPIDVSFAKENPRIASIIWIGYPGEIGGEVLAEALFGEFNPGGRLPVTWYPQSFTNVPMDDMAMRPDPSRGYPGRTYRFYTGPVVYEFGYGLSYSTYSYKFIYAPTTIRLSTSSVLQTHVSKGPTSETSDGLDYVHINKILSCEALKFNIIVSVANDGDIDGSDVVLVYSRPRRRIKGSPLKQLIGFERVEVKAKESTEISILVDPCKHLSNVNEEGERVLVLGEHVTILGDMDHVVNIEI